MSHYKKDAASNRDALFGGGGGGGGGGSSRRPAAPRPAARTQQQPSPSAARPKSAVSVASNTPPPSTYGFANNNNNNNAESSNITPGPSVLFSTHGRRSSAPLSLLSGQAKISKMAEAEDYRLKAKKAMTRGIFSKPDPISAANFYKRAADAYKQCGENRLERLHRIASGDCQLGQDAYATAAAEYTRAAELAENSDETMGRKRQECHKIHLDAANAWSQMGERGRAAESTMKAAFGLIMGSEVSAKIDDKKGLKAVEEAIEAFVPDLLNRKRHYRRTGVSAYKDASGGKNDDDDDYDEAEADQSSPMMQLAKQNIITDSFSHETLLKASTILLTRRHYESALYASGAATAVLEHEGYATVSLYRSFLSETVITLAMGDSVAAKRDFTRVHLQNTQYLSSRECALEEDLVRACVEMDEEELEELRSRSGPHKGALANLDPVVRGLVMEIRVSGRAGKGGGGKSKSKPKAKNKPVSGSSAARAPSKAVAAPVVAKPMASSVPPPPPKKEMSGQELAQNTDAGFDEMDDIMNQMGLNDDDSDDDSLDLT